MHWKHLEPGSLGAPKRVAGRFYPLAPFIAIALTFAIGLAVISKADDVSSPAGQAFHLADQFVQKAPIDVVAPDSEVDDRLHVAWPYAQRPLTSDGFIE